jgi:hypothetical protein
LVRHSTPSQMATRGGRLSTTWPSAERCSRAEVDCRAETGCRTKFGCSAEVSCRDEGVRRIVGSCNEEAGCRVEARCGQEAGCRDEASCGAEVGCRVEVSCGAEAGCRVEASCGAEASCSAEAGSMVEASCNAEAGCEVELVLQDPDEPPESRISWSQLVVLLTGQTAELESSICVGDRLGPVDQRHRCQKAGMKRVALRGHHFKGCSEVQTRLIVFHAMHSLYSL